jgi:aminoglycoside phosphotransferase (APT) family kinase protein
VLEEGVVQTAADARRQTLAPLVVLDSVEAFLDEHGLGSGPVRARRIGVPGGSNFTFLLERDAGRFVLRRPPRPPLPPSAHDMVREARLQLALAKQGIRVPPIVAVCDDEGVIGVPFYVMEHIDGDVIGDDLPPRLAADEAARHRLGLDLVDTLVEIHHADVAEPDLAAFVRPGSYAERQVRRFMQLWPLNATRELPVPEVGERLGATLPEPLPLAVVHGDYRLGNVMLADEEPARLVAIFDWELSTIGDPLADVGYLTVTWAEPDDPADISFASLSAATRRTGFLTRDELTARYEERSGRSVGALNWYQALALWKAAVFMEGNYKRFTMGNSDDQYLALFDEGVPALAEKAREVALSR